MIHRPCREYNRDSPCMQVDEETGDINSDPVAGEKELEETAKGKVLFHYDPSGGSGTQS